MAVSKALRLKILERDNYTCVVCKACYRSRPMTLEIDHKHPVKEGGTDDEWNLRTLCLECNRAKSSKCPECPNCHKPIDMALASCQHCGRSIHTDASQRPDLVRSIARWVLLAAGILLLVFSLGSLALDYGSGLLGKLRGSGSQVTAQTSAGGAVCKVSDTGRVNLRSNCDSMDCDNDSATLAGKIAGGTVVTKTGRLVSSGLNSVGEWVEINANGQISFIAASKLACP